MDVELTGATDILLIASEHAREDPCGSLSRFVRSYRDTLSRFCIHATGGTCDFLVGTGLYYETIVSGRPGVVRHRYGHEGGLVEVAAELVRGTFPVVMFFLDPSDIWSEVPENRTLLRVSKEKKIRLIPTVAAAKEWAKYEADGYTTQAWRDRTQNNSFRFPSNWREGHSNLDSDSDEFLSLALSEQTLALVAHDEKKGDMVRFANRHSVLLQVFDRILTTGTTGYTLKLLFSENSRGDDGLSEHSRILHRAHEELGGKRTRKLMLQTLGTVRNYQNGENLFYTLGREWLTSSSDLKNLEEDTLLKEIDWAKEAVEEELSVPNPIFVSKIIPLQSGPKGGDVLLANEVLTNRCHTVVFFQDPGSAHPHDPDIRLFERTCQFWSSRDPKHRVNASCVSDLTSAFSWAEARTRHPHTLAVAPHRSTEYQLRKRYHLREVVAVIHENHLDKNELGDALATVANDFLFQQLAFLMRHRSDISVGIGPAYIVQQVTRRIGQRPGRSLRRTGNLAWLATLSNLDPVKPERQASSNARVISHDDRLGGSMRAFQLSGFVDRQSLQHEQRDLHTGITHHDRELIRDLSNVDIALMTCSPWDKNGSVYKWCEGLRESQDLPDEQLCVGTMSGTFLEHFTGQEVQSPKVAIGIGYDGIVQVASQGALICVSAGNDYRSTILSALRGGLISILITSIETAEWLAEQ